MIEKLERFDKIIKSKKDYCYGESAGKTLDMSGKRMRMGGEVISFKPKDRGNGSSGHPKHI